MSGPALGVVPLTELTQVVTARLHGGTADDVRHAFESAGCLVATTADGQHFVNGQGLTMPPVPQYEPGRPLDLVADANGHRFKSRVEREHFLFLSYFFPSVQYETTSTQYTDGNGELCGYTPDFYIPGIESLENPGRPGGGVYVESKAGGVSRDELRKCAGIAAQGHQIVLINGYPHNPVSEHRSDATSGKNVASAPDWRRGMSVVTFEAVAGRGRIKRRDNLWFLDSGLPSVRPWLDIDDHGCSHPILLKVYQDIARM